MHDEGAVDPRVAPLISGMNKNMFVFLFQVAIERRGGGYGVRLQRSLGVGCSIEYRRPRRHIISGFSAESLLQLIGMQSDIALDPNCG
jgi:hypothetical protein